MARGEGEKQSKRVRGEGPALYKETKELCLNTSKKAPDCNTKERARLNEGRFMATQ